MFNMASEIAAIFNQVGGKWVPPYEGSFTLEVLELAHCAVVLSIVKLPPCGEALLPPTWLKMATISEAMLNTIFALVAGAADGSLSVMSGWLRNSMFGSLALMLTENMWESCMCACFHAQDLLAA